MTLVLDGRRIGWSVWISVSCLLFLTVFTWPDLDYTPNIEMCMEKFSFHSTQLRCLELELSQPDREVRTLYFLIVVNCFNGLVWFLVGNDMKKWVTIK